MKTLFKFFAHRHKLATLLTLMFFLLGISSLAKMQRDNYPPVDLGQMNIQTIYPGAAPEDVELNVTNKLEDQLKNVTGIKTLTSFSMENLSFIKVVIEPDIEDQVQVKNDIREAVGRVTDLPQEVDDAPLVTDIKTSIFPILEVGIAGDLPYRELRKIARRLEKKLKNVAGVSAIDKYGYRDREIKIEASQKKINEYQVPLGTLVNAIQKRNVRSTGGSFESYTDEKNVVTLAQFRKPEDVGDVIVRSTFEGPSVKVKDLAIINDDFEKETVRSRINGKSAISLNIIKSASADIVRTVDAVKEAVEAEKKNFSPGVEIVYSSDESKTVRARFSIVLSNGVTGLIFVMIMLSVFLNFRTAFWVSMGIPVSLLGVFALMPFFGANLDSMTLSAMILVLGIIVDDAIVISENITRRMELGDSPLEAAANGTKEVFLPVLTTVLTTFCAFVPMFFMPGVMGKFVYLIPLVISLSLFISLGESVFMLPAHLIHGVKKLSSTEAKHQKIGGFFDKFKNLFQKILYYGLKARYICVLLFVVALFGSFLYAAQQMDFILMPSEGAERFMINIELPPGTSLQATADKVKQVEEEVKKLSKSELASFVSRIGRGNSISEQAEHYAYMDVHLTPFGKRSRTADEIIDELRKNCQHIQGFKRLVFSIFAGGPPVGKPVSIRIIGADNAQRRKLTDAVETYLKTIKGVKDIIRDDYLGKEQVEIKIDYEKLSQMELTVFDVAQNVRIAYDGQIVTEERYGDENVNFRVQLPSQERVMVKNLEHLHIPNKQGRLITLKQVAFLESGPGPATYAHYEGERATTIEADIYKGETTPIKVTEDVVDKFDLNKDWPDMRFDIGGEAKETQESMAGLLLAFFIAGLAIYFLLVLLFDSITQPFLVLIAIPFGLTGVIFAFAIHGQPLGFFAIMGVIGLVGVVVNDSLVLVDHLNELWLADSHDDPLRMIAEGTGDRLRAIILTTVTTAAGLLPLAYGFGGSDVFMGPMAMSLGYGVLFSTPLTLVLVPCLYLIGNDIKLFKSQMHKFFITGAKKVFCRTK